MICSNNPTFVVLLNAPPGAGKDWMADILCKDYGFQKLKMTTPMDRALQTLLGMTDAEYHFYREVWKDEPDARFNGRTFRQVLIDFSENFCKPNFGEDFFGGRGAMHVLKNPGHYVVSDSGFQTEVDTFIRDVGPEKCLLVRLEAEGCTFDGDSRGPVTGVACNEEYLFNLKDRKSEEDFLKIVQNGQKLVAKTTTIL